MKMYRVVPDTVGSMITQRYPYSEVKEDILYRLNFMAPEIYEYFGLYKNGMTSEEWTNSMFFFYSPWSCINLLKMIREIYGRPVLARILEYDIPDEIANTSPEVFTNYENCQGKGLLIPRDLLIGNSKLYTEVPGEAEKEFIEMGLKDIEEGLNNIAPFVSKESLSSIREYFAKKGRQIVEDRLKKIGAYPFMKLDNCKIAIFHSDMITNRTMLITKNDLHLLWNIAGGTASDIEIQSLIDRSNGILTMENLAEYDFDRPFHRYGPLITYY